MNHELLSIESSVHQAKFCVDVAIHNINALVNKETTKPLEIACLKNAREKLLDAKRYLNNVDE